MHELNFGHAELDAMSLWTWIQEKYEVGEVICHGRLGTVIKKATHRVTGEHFALKVIRVSEESGGINRAKALREGTLLRSMEHPNIVRLYGLFQSAEEVVLLLEYCDGRCACTRCVW